MNQVQLLKTNDVRVSKLDVQKMLEQRNDLIRLSNDHLSISFEYNKITTCLYLDPKSIGKHAIGDLYHNMIGHSSSFYDFDFDLDQLKTINQKLIDAKFWFLLYKETGLYDCMSKSLIEFFYGLISKSLLDVVKDMHHKKLNSCVGHDLNTILDFDINNIKSVIFDIQNSADSFMTSKVYELFKSLSFPHKTNKANRFSSKCILANRWGSHDSELRELIEILYVLDGYSYQDDISNKVYDILSQKIENPYFEMDKKQNGNIHVKFKDEKCVDILNTYLAMFDPRVLTKDK